jgi:hypothetical protein
MWSRTYVEKWSHKETAKVLYDVVVLNVPQHVNLVRDELATKMTPAEIPSKCEVSGQ